MSLLVIMAASRLGRFAVLAAALASGAHGQPPGQDDGSAPSTTVPAAEDVAQMQLRLAEREFANSVGRAEDLIAKLHVLVDGVDVAARAHEAVQAAMKIDDGRSKNREDVKARIRAEIEALRSTAEAEEALVAEDKTKQKAAQLQAVSKKAAKVAAKKNAKAQALEEKAQVLAKAESEAADKATQEFDGAVKYSEGEVRKILRESAEESQKLAEQLAREEAKQEARRKAQADKDATKEKSIADKAAALLAKEKAARKRAEELEQRAGLPTAAPAAKPQPSLLVEADEPSSAGAPTAPAAPSPAAAGDEVQAAVDRIQREVELKAVSTAPRRFVGELRGTLGELQELRERRQHAVEQAFTEAHKKEVQDIEDMVAAVEGAVEDARGFAKTAIDARKVLGMGAPPEVDTAAMEAEAEKVGAEAKKLEDKIFREGQKELKKDVHSNIGEGEKEARVWEAEAKDLQRRADKANDELHRYTRQALAAEPAAGAAPLLAAAGLAAACVVALAHLRGRRTDIDLDSPLLG